jgi:hypothetical protein
MNQTQAKCVLSPSNWLCRSFFLPSHITLLVDAFSAGTAVRLPCSVGYVQAVVGITLSWTCCFWPYYKTQGTSLSRPLLPKVQKTILLELIVYLSRNTMFQMQHSGTWSQPKEYLILLVASYSRSGQAITAWWVDHIVFIVLVSHHVFALA